MKTILIIPLALLACGCSAWTEAQLRLVEQSQLGLEQLRASHAQRQSVVEQYHLLQRGQLDDAFDVDVRQAADLSPDWIIEHRRAYAAALDLLHRQRSASADASSAADRNISAIKGALLRLKHLQEMQLRLFGPEQPRSGESR